MASGIDMKILGTKQIIDNLNKLSSRTINAVGGGLYLEANNIITDSKKLVPVDLGTLKGSGYVTLPEISLSNVKVEIGYGGSAKDYAVVQHEHTEFKHPGGGQAKFLEKPMYYHMTNFSKKVIDFSRRLFEANRGFTKTSTPTDPNQGGKK